MIAFFASAFAMLSIAGLASASPEPVALGESSIQERSTSWGRAPKHNYTLEVRSELRNNTMPPHQCIPRLSRDSSSRISIAPTTLASTSYDCLAFVHG
jgi:hypothetical protein